MIKNYLLACLVLFPCMPSHAWVWYHQKIEFNNLTCQDIVLTPVYTYQSFIVTTAWGNKIPSLSSTKMVLNWLNQCSNFDEDNEIIIDMAVYTHGTDNIEGHYLIDVHGDAHIQAAHVTYEVIYFRYNIYDAFFGGAQTADGKFHIASSLGPFIDDYFSKSDLCGMILDYQSVGGPSRQDLVTLSLSN